MCIKNLCLVDKALLNVNAHALCGLECVEFFLHIFTLSAKRRSVIMGITFTSVGRFSFLVYNHCLVDVESREG